MAYHAGRRAQRIAAVSPYVQRHLRRYGFHAKAMDVIPNGVPESIFSLARQRSETASVTYVSLLSGWSRGKNGAAAIGAFARVHGMLPGCRLVMFGSGYGPSEAAAQWAISRGWAAGIDFRGRVPHAEVIRFLAHEADILVHTSLEESFGMPLVEAASLAVPVIAGARSGAVPWVLGGEDCGILVDVRQPEVIADAMLKLGRDFHLRNRLGRRAREAAKKRFHISRVADRYEEIYDELARAARQ